MSTNDKDIRIGIGIDADTTGAEEAEKALAKVNKEAAKSDGVGDDGRAASQRRSVRAEEEQLAKRAISDKEDETRATRELSSADDELFKGLQERLDAMRETVDARQNGESSGSDGLPSLDKISKLSSAAATLAGPLIAINFAAQAASGAIGVALENISAAGADIDKLKEGNPGSFAFFEAVKGIANPLEMVKGLIGDIVDASVSGLLDLDGLKRSQIQAADMAFQLERGKAALDDMDAADKALRLDNLRSRGILLKAENDELERRQQILSAERSLSAVQGKIADETRIAKGENPNLVASERVVSDASADAAKLQDSLDTLNLAIKNAALGVEDSRAAENEAKGEVRKLALEFEESAKILREARSSLEVKQSSGEPGEKEAANVRAAESAFDDAKRAYEEGKQAVTKASTDSLAADSAFDSAKKDFGAQLEINAIAVQEIGLRAKDKIQKLATDSSSTVTEEIKGALDLINKSAEEQGGKLSAGAKQAFDNLQRIVTDNTPDGAQVEAVRAQFMLLQSTAEGRDAAFGDAIKGMTDSILKSQANAKEILSTVASIQGDQNSLISSIRATNDEQQRIKSQINQLRSR